MDLSGKNYLGKLSSAKGEQTLQGYDPKSDQLLPPLYFEATSEEIDYAFERAEEAFEEFQKVKPKRKAEFLRCIADEILNIGDELIQRAESETALPEGRLKGERLRTVNQLKMFADLVEEGSWVEARIDTALPDREPLSRPDIRQMLVPLGPVVVFGASNFPLAFSVAGGDTASALAAGCPVLFKAHPAHPGTSEIVALAILRSVIQKNMPDGIFSLLHGASHHVGLQMVQHPLARAVGFTGSLAGGRALFDAATERKNPIPVYAEMGSVNPMFLFPSVLKYRNDEIAEGLVNSVTLGTGQFCTNPGLVFISKSDETEIFISILESLINSSATGTMLYPGICKAYEKKTDLFRNTPGIELIGNQSTEDSQNHSQVRPVFFTTNTKTFLDQKHLSEEVFGPASLIVQVENPEEFYTVAQFLEGQLTATIHGSRDDLSYHRKLVDILQKKAGRLIFNVFPTGVEVCASMHHGGPYPATTDIRSTSVGTAAIKRFVRPVCYQNFPEEALPPELWNNNPGKIWRLVDNEFKNPNQETQ